MKRTLYSMSMVFLLVMSLFPAVMAQEAEETPNPTVELLDVQALQEAIAEAEAQQEYAKANYQITLKIVTADCVIEYGNTNYPDAESIPPLQNYREALVDLRDGLTLDSEFSDVMQDLSSYIDEGKEAVSAFLLETGAEKEALKEYVGQCTEESTVDDEAKEAFTGARVAVVYARANAILAGLDNFRIVAEEYVDAETLDEYKAILDEINVKVDELAAAVEADDKETTKTLAAEIKDLIKEAKDIAKGFKEEIKAAREEERESGNVGSRTFKPVPKELSHPIQDPREDETEATETTGEETVEDDGTEETETTTETTEDSETEETETTVEAEAEVIAEVE